jgi:glycosyltransferase involved in cell wall biosynthesis
VGMSDAPTTDTIGVVVPTLNCASFLADTLSSIRKVQHIGQVIIADSGSTDGTLDIARAAGVDILYDAPPGLYPALNAGFQRMGTSWLTYINADDLLQPAGIAKLFAERGEYDILYGPVDFITADGSFIHCWHSARPADMLPLFRAGVSAVLQQGTLFRRSLFESLQGFREQWQFVADADLWWRAAEAGARCFRASCPPVASFRMHPEQLSRIHRACMRDEYRQMAVSHGVGAPTIASCYAVARYRTARWRSYLVRFLRQGDLRGACRLKASYEY